MGFEMDQYLWTTSDKMFFIALGRIHSVAQANHLGPIHLKVLQTNPIIFIALFECFL